MSRALSAHLQEDTVVYMQHMVLSISTRVRGGLSVHSLSENSSCVPKGHHELIFRRIPLYTCSIWYCHSSWWPVRTQLEFSLKLCTDRPPRTLVESDSTLCCMYTTVSSWRWALKARNM